MVDAIAAIDFKVIMIAIIIGINVATFVYYARGYRFYCGNNG